MVRRLMIGFPGITDTDNTSTPVNTVWLLVGDPPVNELVRLIVLNR